MDFDLQLQQLQRQLMMVQQQKTNPLSQRTVAEIMVKLHHDGLAFVPTTDGNQYVTPQQIDKQILTLIKERNKMNITLLPPLLNIGLDTVQTRIIHLTQQALILRFNQNLYSHKYFDQLITSLAQDLKVSGRIELEGVAIKHDLSLKYVQKLISENLHKLHADLTGNLLITKQYRQLKKVKIFGFLLAVSNPLHLQIVYKLLGDDPKEIQVIMHELIQENKIKGKIQGGYFVPQKFISHQKKLVNQFLQTNGYLDCEMLQKKYMVVKPEEWVSKNMKEKFIKIQKIYFKQQKIQSISSQLNSMLKAQGFCQLSGIIPIQFQQKTLQLFLEENCGLKEYFISDGFIYSNQWLDRLTNQFKYKIIHSIFFKKTQNKKDNKKKTSKKTQIVTQQELQQVLFNCGFTGFTQASNLAPQLLPLLLIRVEELKKKIEKQLTQSKGLITSNFLKYRSCLSIVRSEQSLNMRINTIQKQIKKTQKWKDIDFGPSQTDPIGQYSLIYYDNVVPKGWSILQSLNWVQFHPSDLLKRNDVGQYKSNVSSLLSIIDYHNSKNTFKLNTPQIAQLTQESVQPFIYKFYISKNQQRYVVVDNLLPVIEHKPFSVTNKYALCEKAYAKLRYCYKGLMAVGIHQMIYQFTGQDSLRYVVDNQPAQKQMIIQLSKYLKQKAFICVFGEGEHDKKMVLEQTELQMYPQIPYYIQLLQQNTVSLNPSGINLRLQQLVKLFRSIFIINKPHDKQ